MKRYLTVGIVSGVLLIAVVAISWFLVPGWHNLASGGFWVLVGAAAVGVITFVQGMVSIWKDLKEETKASTSQSVDSQKANSIYNAPGGTINVYPPAIMSVKPTSEETESFWYIPHPYPMPPNFTGRGAEQKMLDEWLADDKDRLFILRALGGFGKSALAWQWINTHVNPAEWTKLVWWSFYEGDTSFEHFVEETLKYLKLEVPQGQRPQVDELLQTMQSQKILLIIDGFERAFRAYSSMNAAYQGDEESDLSNPQPPFSPVGEKGGAAPSAAGDGEVQADCVNINAEIFLKSISSLPNIKGKVLMTTRLIPRCIKPHGEFLQGCREEELNAMQKEDAVEFFKKQKIKGTHAEIESACAPYGYHPLSLRLLAGHILKDFENPADIVVVQKLKIDGDLRQHQHHILEVSYNSLPHHEQKLLSTIACFRSPVTLDTLRAIAESKETLEEELHDLVQRGLLHHEKQNKKFDLHPIVRHYAYAQFTNSERKKTHTDLAMHFIDIMPVTNRNIKSIDDLAPVIELYYHLVMAGQFDDAVRLLSERLVPHPLHFQFGAYQLIIELEQALFTKDENRPIHLSGENSQSRVRSSLAITFDFTGQSVKAIPLFEESLLSDEEFKDEEALIYDFGNLANAQLHIGIIKSAEQNMRRRIELCNEIQNEQLGFVTNAELGHLLSYRGSWNESEQQLSTAESAADKYGISQTNMASTVHSYHALRILLMNRDLNKKPIKEYKLEAIEFAQRALEQAEARARIRYPTERDFVRAHWLLGAAYRLDEQLGLAEHHLSEALARDRAINMVDHEADILLEIARLRYDQKKYDEAKSLAEEALTITERCGYVLQGADVNLFLAQYALKQEKDKVKAKEYAEEAKKLATCDGPPYYYKVAYEEAERMLEKLK